MKAWPAGSIQEPAAAEIETFHRNVPELAGKSVADEAAMRWVHEDDHVPWLTPVAGFLASQAPDPEPLLAGFGPSLRRSPTWVAAAAAEHVAGFA